MKTVLVSGASGIIGYGILRSLRSADVNLKLIGTTIYEDSVAANFCDIFEKAVPTHDDGYLDWIIAMIDKHDIDLIIPGIEADMYRWSELRSEIENTGVKLALNDTALISLCKDKWNFYKRLQEHNSPYAITTSIDPGFETISSGFGLPFLLKPRCGHGSKGIVRVNNREEYLAYEQAIGNNLMVQPIIGSEEEEYSISAFCDGQGSYYACMAIKRILSKQGFTEKAEVVETGNMEEALNSLCSLFKPVGPTNFQFRKQDGQLKLLEINPRISSATSIRTAFGYNESLMAVEYFLDNKMPAQPDIKKGTATRYTEDFIVYE